ncbi:metallophosphoesterase [Oleiharenicola lentus]|uniref:Metallophosphoesterase n=1 Tax=Oleiharenicola lentus TaxID=2508720 RepID=A0A4Q1C556_9BACT|nr:metallophosphatase domain-containing protein [Oleiharenicola lentus]RXK53550.1 metallophosphoesterase [Oleiharenicola lentus]
MRIVAISDTHHRHEQVVVPDGDVLVHAGDLTRSGDPAEVIEVMRWLTRLPHRHKIFIAGNHDWVFELQPAVAAGLVPAGVTYLQDSGCEIDGVRFWGSPVQPTFLNWAFNRARGEEIDRHWQQIPIGIDVLITHGPPHGLLDLAGSEHAGCEMLRRRVEIIRPVCHIFGHIHGARGTDTLGSTRLINAAICTEDYRPINPPFVLDLQDGIAAIHSGAGLSP